MPVSSVPATGRRAVLLNDTTLDHHHGCTLVARTIATLASANGIAIVARSPVHHDWRTDRALQITMESADLIIVNGEGTIHNDRPAGLALLDAGPWSRQRGIPAALINMTWEANSAAAVENLKQFSFVSVREQASRAELAGLGFDPWIAPDLALYSVATTGQLRSGVGVTDSVLPHVSASLEVLRRRFGGHHISILHSRPGILERARSARKFGAVATSPATLWRAAQASIQERLSETRDADEFARRVARCRLLVTGRFHAVVVALATRTPVLAVASNTHKIQATLRDAGLEPFRIAQPDTIDADLIERAANWSDGEVKNLNAYISDGRRKIEMMFATLAGLA